MAILRNIIFSPYDSIRAGCYCEERHFGFPERPVPSGENRCQYHLAESTDEEESPEYANNVYHSDVVHEPWHVNAVQVATGGVAHVTVFLALSVEDLRIANGTVFKVNFIAAPAVPIAANLNFVRSAANGFHVQHQRNSITDHHEVKNPWDQGKH